MINEQNHIIQKLSVEVNVPDLSMARRIHNNIGSFIQDSVLPAVEKKLNELIKKEEYYRTGDLTLDLFFDRESDLENLLPAVLCSALTSQAVESLSGKTSEEPKKNIENVSRKEATDFQKKTEEEKNWDLFIHFLQTGRLPWYAGTETIIKEDQLLQLIASDERKNVLKKLFAQYPFVQERLAKQFCNDFVIQVAEKLSGISFEVYWRQIEQSLSRNNTDRDTVRKKILAQLFDLIVTNTSSVVAAEKKFEAFVSEIAAQFLNREQPRNSSDKTIIKREVKKKKQISSEEVTGIYIQNGGLILLHPFLLYFLKEFDLLNAAGSFKNEGSQQTAIHLLHYLATGNEQPFEYDLLMEKFLCGYAIDEPAERFIVLTDKMKEECDHLLKAVIHHWKVLKNTSPDGLRQGFLQRNGKLALTAYQHRLIIESNTIDILLNQLPWNYSIIQLPWLQQVFYVDWLIN